jgi:hypothetical protein
MSSFVFFFFLLSLPDLFYLLTVGVGGYCFASSHSMTHTRQRSPGQVIGPSQRPLLDNTRHSQQTLMLPVEFEPSISASEWPQTHALDGAATGIGHLSCTSKYTSPFVYRGFCRLHGMRLNVSATRCTVFFTLPTLAE